MFAIEITPQGARHLNHLPIKVREAAIALLFGALSEAPQRLGKPLVGEFEGLWSARRGDYRVIYEIDEERRLLIVHRIQPRADVYRER